MTSARDHQLQDLMTFAKRGAIFGWSRAQIVDAACEMDAFRDMANIRAALDAFLPSGEEFDHWRTQLQAEHHG